MNNDFRIEYGVLGKYHGSDSNVVVPDGVTKIGYCAFENLPFILSVDLPESVVTIDRLAFFGCSRLVEINLPDSLTTIGERAFRDCRSLDEITLPNGITNIQSNSFDSCDGLAEITIYGETFIIEEIMEEYDYSEIAEDYGYDEDEFCNVSIAVHNEVVSDLLNLLIIGEFDKVYMPEDLRYEIIASVLKHKPANVNFLNMAKKRIAEITPYLLNEPEIIQYLNETGD